jgi:hypothetical protein
MNKSDFYDNLMAFLVGIIGFMMPLLDMFLVAGVFITLAFVMKREEEKKKNGKSFGFWKGFGSVLKTTFFRGMFVAAAYCFDYFIASKYLYPILQESLHPGIQYVVTILVLIGTCWHYLTEADSSCKVVYNRGIFDSLEVLFDKVWELAKKLKNIKSE